MADPNSYPSGPRDEPATNYYDFFPEGNDFTEQDGQPILYENHAEDNATSSLIDMIDDRELKMSIDFWANFPEEYQIAGTATVEESREDNDAQEHHIPIEPARTDVEVHPEEESVAVSDTYSPQEASQTSHQSVSQQNKPTRHPEDSKNLLINVGTQLKNYFQRQFRNTRTLQLFYQLFGRRKTYKSLKRFSALFASPLREHCIDFFDHHVLRMILTSKASKKSAMIKYLGVLRQGAVRGYITNLTLH